MAPASVSVEQAFRPAAGVLAQRVSDQCVLLDSHSGRYYSLNEVGGRVWELCDGSINLADAIAVIESEYEAPAGAVRGDVVSLVTELLAEHLLVVDA